MKIFRENCQLLSVIIPTLNEEYVLGRTLSALTKPKRNIEVIVVDGGSTDSTIEIARQFGARIIKSKAGRGTQLQAGALHANGENLWFLHADTVPPPDWYDLINKALISDNAAVGGNFEIRFEGHSRAARFMTWLYPELRRIGLYYGDSAIFVRSAVFKEVGGFRPYPLFEDVEFAKRLIKSGRFLHLAAAVSTSSRRFEERSFLLMFASWSVLQALYWIGVPPTTLIKRYRPLRSSRIGHRSDYELLRRRSS